ncbi:SPJ_0845 family protein [Enterococcus cecorum]|uniref:SPJ_0845 family protein n=1 Tax=Enterococcus cecorum TaxID=44008 RepID=UPI0032632AE0
MGLKFQKDDFLEKKLEEFIVFPDDLKKKKEEVDIERFLNPKPKTEKKKKQINKRNEEA